MHLLIVSEDKEFVKGFEKYVLPALAEAFVDTKRRNEIKAEVIAKFATKYHIVDDYTYGELKIPWEYIPLIDSMRNHADDYHDSEAVMGSALYDAQQHLMVIISKPGSTSLLESAALKDNKLHDPLVEKVYELHKADARAESARLRSIAGDITACLKNENEQRRASMGLLVGAFHTTFGRPYSAWRNTLPRQQ